VQSSPVEHEELIVQVLRITASWWYTWFVLAQSPTTVAVYVPLMEGS
jgi:hypothetical protein